MVEQVIVSQYQLGITLQQDLNFHCAVRLVRNQAKIAPHAYPARMAIIIQILATTVQDAPSSHIQARTRPLAFPMTQS